MTQRTLATPRSPPPPATLVPDTLSIRQARENDPAALRAKARAAQLQADMDNAADLFGGATVNGGCYSVHCG